MISYVSLANYRNSNYSMSVSNRRFNEGISFTGRNIVKNTVVMMQDDRSHFTFFDGCKKIGYAILGEYDKYCARIGNVPDSWILPNGIPNEKGQYPLKPSLYITEFVMDDKVGLVGTYKKRAENKKYGVMCMQKLLEWAEKRGFGHRISLTPGKTHSDIDPAIFYTKLGFDVSPEISSILKLTTSARQINGRFVSRGQEVFLVEPEVLKNYPLV